MCNLITLTVILLIHRCRRVCGLILVSFPGSSYDDLYHKQVFFPEDIQQFIAELRRCLILCTCTIHTDLMVCKTIFPYKSCLYIMAVIVHHIKYLLCDITLCTDLAAHGMLVEG